ncbi:hypothetical protein [Pseudoalteromonas phage KB12-38]|nr:hypothetical protein [Pseudoalteromonas phage KB12-38]
MAAFTASQVSIEHGKKIVAINSGESIANINSRDFLSIGTYLAEINRAYVGISGEQLIELTTNWPHSTQTNVTCIVIPTTGNFAAAVQSLKDAHTLVNTNFATMHDWQTKAGNVTFIHPDGTRTTVPTLPDIIATQRSVATLEQMLEATSNNTLVTPFNFKATLDHHIEQGGFGGGSDRETTRLYLADYVDDPSNVDSVDTGIAALNEKMTKGMTIDLSGDYVWPTTALVTNNVEGLKITGGSFTRETPSQGVEYIIRVQFSENTLITGVTLDGASVGTNWGSQGIYVSRSRNTIIMGNTFKNVGDGVIRYAYKPSSSANSPVTSTDGMIIALNTFENCQQVTSNATGGKNVVISSNSFINSAVKVTQAVPGESGWTIITDNTFRDSLLDAPVTMQGGNNLLMHNNTVENCKGLFNFYPNNGSLYGDNIVSSNIYITHNKCRTALGNRMVYGEVRGGQAPNSVIPIEGDLVIKGNTFERLDGYTETLNNTIGLYCYVPNANIAKNVIIEDNDFKGDHRTLVQFGGDGAHYLPADGSLSIRRNKGKSIYNAFFVNVEAIEAGQGDVFIEHNEVTCPQFITGNFVYANGAIRVYSVRDNTAFIINTGGIFGTQMGLSYTAKTPIALSTIVVKNHFHYLDNSGDGVTFGLGAPRISDAGNYQLVMTDNVVTSKEGSQGITPIYVRANSDSKPFASLIFNNNIAELDPVKNTLSHDTNVPESLITFINKDLPAVQLISSISTKAGDYFTLKRTWSDGRHVQTGFTKLDFASPASGNIYLNPASPSEDYTVQITPRHSTPLLHTVTGQGTNSFQPRFSDHNGNSVAAEFNYTAEWFI